MIDKDSILTQIANDIHKKQIEKGFWDEPKTFEFLIMCCIIELSKLSESHYEQKYVNDFSNKKDEYKNQEWFKEKIKNSFESRIAKLFIRLFDICGFLGIDIDFYIELEIFKK